jgi:2,4-dienoyl-CoA reductase-like NADH-dependent reductase (Old Yellow Enzyme family)/thioredoxin reductase
MNLIRSLMGRRQFLITAGVTSTSALAYTKFAGLIDPIYQTGSANAAVKSGTSDIKGGIDRYIHLLAPLKIRNVIVKNRIIHTTSNPHFIQGPETFPSDVVRAHYAGIAKNAAIVACRLSGDAQPRKEIYGNGAHMMQFDTSDPAVQNYIDQMVEGVHSMGSLVSGGNLGGGPGGMGMGGPGIGGGASPANPVKIRDLIVQAKALEDQGIDVVSMGTGNVQDKSAISSAVEQMQAVRNATNLIIKISMTVIDPSTRPETCDRSGGILLEDAIATAKAFEDAADILEVQAFTGMNNHPMGFNQKKGDPMALRISTAIKESGAKILLAPRGGFRDPDMNEDFIASGKCDMICMARPFIADPEYTEKIYEGRGEDIVPCLMCDKCHGTYTAAPWITFCSVNPKFGIAPALQVIKAPASSKKVAVIGGGPAGMKAAITAAERGHKVTLYEKNDYLGGLLRHADFSPYKWPLKDFKDYLVRQVNKTGVEVHLSKEATPELIRSKGYDAVLVAIGAEPVIPRIPGADGSNIYNVVNVFPKEKSLGKNVVLIGGGEFGTETGMFLANAGHNVMVLTSEKELLRINSPHSQEIVTDTYEFLENFNFVDAEAIATRISDGKVIYKDAGGNEKSLPADSVVIYAGLKARQDETLKFFGSAKAFFALGDCTGKCGNVQKSIRSAFFAASQV